MIVMIVTWTAFAILAMFHRRHLFSRGEEELMEYRKVKSSFCPLYICWLCSILTRAQYGYNIKSNPPCALVYMPLVWYDAPISPTPDRHYFTRYCYGCATHITVGLTSITSVPVSLISLGFPVFRVFPVSKSCTSTKHTLM